MTDACYRHVQTQEYVYYQWQTCTQIYQMIERASLFQPVTDLASGERTRIQFKFFNKC